MRPIIERASQLEEHSSWRKYQRAIKELELMEAPKSTIREFKIQAARDCFLAYAEIMLDGNLKVAPFHELIAEAFQDVADGRYPRLIVSCAPRSGKSLLSQLFVSWLVGKEDKNSHIIGSYGLQLSGKFQRGIMKFTKHRSFKSIFPEFTGFVEGSKNMLLAGGEVMSTSPGGALTGFTAGSWSLDSKTVGTMFVDDPLKNSDSMAALQGLETWWQEEASTRRTNRWAQVLIATRFHTRDLHGILTEGDGLWDAEENPNGWRWLNIPAVCEDPATDPLERVVGETHWPDHPVFSTEMLASQKKIMGSNKFAALYQGSPKSEDGSIFQPRYWVTHEPVKARVCWISCDTAFSEKQTADESVLAVWGMRDVPADEKDDKFYLMDIRSGRWSFPDLLDNLKALSRIYNPRCLVIEQAASGQSLIQMLKKEAKIHIHPYKPIKSKTQRLQQVLPLFESDRVRICEGIWNDDLRKQLFDFPFVVHDDQVDAVVWGLHYASEMLDGTKEEMYAATLKAKSWTGMTARNKDLGIVGSRNGRALFDGGERAAAWGGLHEDNRDYNTGRSSRPGRTGGFDDSRW
jgi:predicted phage terminase large subunit-like protein